MLVCCDLAEKSCISLSDFLVKSCNWCCPTDRPAPLYTAFSFLMNIIMMIVAAAFLGKDAGDTCSTGGKCRGYYIAFFPLCIINMIFAVYIYRRFMANMQKGNRACKTMSKLLLYDIGVYLYLFINPVFVIVWMCLGWQMCGDETVCTNISKYYVMVALLGTYFGGGIVFFFMSVMVQCCYEDGTAHAGGPAEGASSAGYHQYSASSSSSNATKTNNIAPRNNSTPQQNSNSNTNSATSGSSTLATAGVVAGAALSLAGRGVTALGSWVAGSGNNNNQQQQQQQQQQQHQTYQEAQIVIGQTIYSAPPPQQQQQNYSANPYQNNNVNNNQQQQQQQVYQQPQYVQPQHQPQQFQQPQYY